MNKSTVIGIALAFLLVPGALFAQGTVVSKVLCGEPTEMSDEQCAKLVDLRTEHQMAGIKLGAELKILKLRMCQELAKDDPSAKELEDLVSKMGAARAELQKKWIDHLLQARKILEPEQWKTFRRCFADMADPCAAETNCMDAGGCGVGGDSPVRMVLSGTGQCGPARCVTVDKNCASMCGDRTAGGCCCETAMAGTKGCAPGKSSCQTTESQCIKMRCGD